MRTLKKLLSLLALLAPFAVNAQGLDDKYKEGLHSLEDECYALLKFDWPTSTLINKLDYYYRDLGWDPYIVRRFAYDASLCESGGVVESDNGEDFGCLGMHENTGMYDEHCRILRDKGLPVPKYTERDMANPAKGYYVTRILPLEVLNNVAREHKWGYQWRITPEMKRRAKTDKQAQAQIEEYIMKAMEEIIRRWNGHNGHLPENRHKTELHWQKFKYGYTYCISALEEEGFACGYSPIPEKVLRPNNWKD